MSAPEFDLGVARRALPTPIQGTGMMGWGMLHNVVQGSRTPLHARAFFIRRGEITMAIVCLELAFVSIAIKSAVLERLAAEAPELGLSEVNLLMCATHTHSAPGGYTHYPFYNITIPGFVGDWVEGIAATVVAALREAAEGARPGRLRYREGEFSSSSTVAFNRSVASYNLNRDVERVDEGEPTLALDRTMRLLEFVDEAGESLGSINWFAVHATSVHSDNLLVHFDNKGYAAKFVEAAHGGVAAFAQGAAGDVTPNYRSYPEKPWVRGADLDDDRSAQINGELQAAQARSILAKSPAHELAGALAFAHRFVDFSDVEVEAKYAEGVEGRRTGPAEIGWAMFFGTDEGPGIDRRLLFTQGWGQRLRRTLMRRQRSAARREIQGDKLTLIESGRRRILGAERFGPLRVLGRLSPALAQLVALDQSERPDAKPWTPQVLPIQLLQIGSLAIVAVPAEFTTVAGRRLRASVAEALAARGVERVVLCGYANAYAGYVTTPEEYAVQDYEGASTHFGTWTLGAYQSEFDRLASDLGVGTRAEATTGPRPPRFDAADLEGRRYSGSGLEVSAASASTSASPKRRRSSVASSPVKVITKSSP